MFGIWWTYQGFCSSPFSFSRGSLFALPGSFSGFVECLKESVSFWSKSLTVCSDSVPAEVPFYASSLEFVECLREFRRFAKCAPPLNDFLHFFLWYYEGNLLISVVFVDFASGMLTFQDLRCFGSPCYVLRTTHIVTLHHHTIIPPWRHAILTSDHHTITPS